MALEANLNLTEMCQVALDIGAVSSLPLILDGACGFGDPMHMHRTIGMAEAAGFAAIEIEDQLVPKRARTPEQLRAIAERLGGPLMYLTGRGGLAGLGLSLSELGAMGYRIVADPTTPLLAAFGAWRQVYRELANDFGAGAREDPQWPALEHEMLDVIGLERLLEVERRTVEAPVVTA